MAEQIAWMEEQITDNRVAIIVIRGEILRRECRAMVLKQAACYWWFRKEAGYDWDRGVDKSRGER